MIGNLFYVLHSSYPDGTWRGVEKCAGHEHKMLLFHTQTDAETFMRDNEVDPTFVVVEVTLVTPFIREPLDAATFEKVDPLLPVE